MTLQTSPCESRNGSVRAPVDEQLLSNFYDDFRRIARRMLNRCSGQVTIQPTDLVHEAALRLLAGGGVRINDESHFLALGARAIRTTLIDEIRRRKAAKRDCDVVTCWDRSGSESVLDVESFDAALDQLASFEPEGARIVELRFYVGLTMNEIANVLALSESTALRRWRIARAWLLKELGTGD